MNIFFLHKNPRIAAKNHCDKHVPKMILETAQILCTVLHKEGLPPESIPYKKTHPNHPCTIWAGSSRENFEWTLELGFNLCMEFSRRFKKLHKTEFVLNNIEKLVNRYDILNDSPQNTFTTPALAMPEDCRNYSTDAVECYRAYYIRYKRWFARWDKGDAKIPSWYTNSFSKQVLLTMTFNMQPVDSLNIAEIGYDEDSSTMRVKFNNAQMYDYNPVTQDEFDDLLYAESVGKAFYKLTKGKEGLKYDRVTE